MPKAGDEFTSMLIDGPHSTGNRARLFTYRYQENGRTVDPVKVVERQIMSIEVRFSSDPWQPAQWVYNYGPEEV